MVNPAIYGHLRSTLYLSNYNAVSFIVFDIYHRVFVLVSRYIQKTALLLTGQRNILLWIKHFFALKHTTHGCNNLLKYSAQSFHFKLLEIDSLDIRPRTGCDPI